MAKRSRPPGRREIGMLDSTGEAVRKPRGVGQRPDELQACVVVVTGSIADQKGIDDLLSHGHVVVLAPTVAVAARWLDEPPGAVSEGGPLAGILQMGDLEVDLDTHCVLWRKTRVHVSERELQILALLARDPRKTWTFADLTKEVWHDPYIGDPSAVRGAVKRLRKKLDSAGTGVVIQSVRSVGFRLSLTNPIQPLANNPPPRLDRPLSTLAQ